MRGWDGEAMEGFEKEMHVDVEAECTEEEQTTENVHYQRLRRATSSCTILHLTYHVRTLRVC
jgi:hypothetical protein